MVEIKITGNTPLEALASVSAFGLRCFSDPDVFAATNRILEAERAKERKEAAKAPELDAAAAAPMGAEAAAVSAPPQAPVELPPEPYIEEPPHGAPAPAPESKTENRPEPPKLEEVRAKGLEAAKKRGQPAVKAILESFGVPSMTNLAEGDRAAFLEKLAELESQGDGNA